MSLELLKWLHLISATLLVGTGFGSAFYKWQADRSHNLQAIAQTNRIVVIADWWFTTPAIILQPLTGIALAHLKGYPLSEPWIVAAFALYLIAGACWLPVVWLQIRMRELAREAVEGGTPLPDRYWRCARRWFWLGVPAFVAMAVIYYLMVAKPGFI